MGWGRQRNSDGGSSRSGRRGSKRRWATGHFEIEGNRIRGWAVGRDHEAEGTWVHVGIDRVAFCAMLATENRHDIARVHGLSNVCCGFQIQIPATWMDGKPHDIAVQVLPDGLPLRGKGHGVVIQPCTLLSVEPVVSVTAFSHRLVAVPWPAHLARTASGTYTLRARIRNLERYRDSEHYEVLEALSDPIEIPIPPFVPLTAVREVIQTRPGPIIVPSRGVLEESCVTPFHEVRQALHRLQKAVPKPYVAGCGETLLIQRGRVQNYFHWMTESLPRALLAEYAVPGDAPCIEIISSGILFIDSSIALFGLSSRVRHHRKAPLLYVEDALLPPFHRKATTYDTRIDPFLLLLVERYRAMHPHASECSRRLFLDRADASSGRILNASEIHEVARRAGFEVVTLEGLDVADQATLLRQASHVVGVHGAALTNLLFAAPGTRVLEILPEPILSRVRCFADLAVVVGAEYFLHVQDGEMSDTHDFAVDVARFEQSLDEMMA